MTPRSTIALLAEEKKAADILVLDVSSLTTVTEAFVICTGGSEPQLAAITDQDQLKRMSVSGAIRWEDRASIGYYAYDNDPNAYDPSRRVYDKRHTYVDLGAGYNTRIFSNKVGLRVQLNVRNLTNSYLSTTARWNADFSGARRIYLRDPRSYRLTFSADY